MDLNGGGGREGSPDWWKAEDECITVLSSRRKNLQLDWKERAHVEFFRAPRSAEFSPELLLFSKNSFRGRRTNEETKVWIFFLFVCLFRHPVWKERKGKTFVRKLRKET